VRAASEQSNPEQLTQRVAELMQRVVELSDYVRQKTRGAEQDQQAGFVEPDSLVNPIELLTENGFTIVRAWEVDSSLMPADGNFRFIVDDPQNHQCEITVQVASRLIAETVMRTGGRIHDSSTFWICCAERHLAEYLTEHNDLPDENQLNIDAFDCEEVISVLRWGTVRTWE
jgi:hypothetical protein